MTDHQFKIADRAVRRVIRDLAARYRELRNVRKANPETAQ